MSGPRDSLLQDDDDKVPSPRVNLRILLVGKTGSGKSATGNTILGREGRAAGNTILGTTCFESRSSPRSVTKDCKIGEVMSGEMTITVTDTPGVYDTDSTREDVKPNLSKCIDLTVPGPHVFLLVLSVVGRYNREEKNAVQWICNNFVKLALQYAIVLFTRMDQLEDMTLEQYIGESDDLKKLIRDCGGRFHGFNNKNENPHQVPQLIQKIEHMVESNRGKYYTNDEYKTAQKQIEHARRLKKAKEVALGVASGVGVAAAVSGGVVLGVTGLVALPAVLIGAGVTAALGGGPAVIANQINKV